MKIIDDFLKVARQDLSYCDPILKDQFHARGKRVLKQIADRLGLDPGTYEIRSNKGGIAVSGEVTLHGEDIHLWFTQSRGPIIIFRRCNGRKDDVGERNHQKDAEELRHFDNLCDQIQAVRERGAIHVWL